MAQHILGCAGPAVLCLWGSLALHARLPVLQPGRAQLLQDDRRDYITVQETCRARPSRFGVLLRLGLLHVLLDHVDFPPRRRPLPLHARRDWTFWFDRHRRYRVGSVVRQVHHPAVRAHVQLPRGPDGEPHGHRRRHVLGRAQRRGAHHPGFHARHGPANHPGRQPRRHLRHRTQREEPRQHRLHAPHLHGPVDGHERGGETVREGRLGRERQPERGLYRPDLFDLSRQGTLRARLDRVEGGMEREEEEPRRGHEWADAYRRGGADEGRRGR